MVREVHGGEVPPEDPVEEGRVVVSQLLIVAVPDCKSVGYLKERPLVPAEKLLLEEGASLLKRPGEGDDRGTAVFGCGRSASEQGDSVLDRVGGAVTML